MTDPATRSETTTPEPAMSPMCLSPEQLARLRSLAVSRWVARLWPYGEMVATQSEDPFRLGTPSVILTDPSIGASLAGSCVGIAISSATSDAGLRGDVKLDGLEFDRRFRRARLGR